MSQKKRSSKTAFHTSTGSYYLLPLVLSSIISSPLSSPLLADTPGPEVVEGSVSTGYVPVERALLYSVELCFEGEETLEKERDLRKKVLGIMETKEGLPYFPHLLDKDVKKIAQSFDILSSSLANTPQGYHLKMTLRERKKIASIVWHGDQKIPSKNYPDLSLSEGDLYAATAALSVKRKVLDHYNNKGYQKTQITHEILPSNKLGQVELHFYVTEGDPSSIISLEFEGIEKSEVKEVRKLLLSRERSMLGSLIGRPGVLVEEWLDYDVLSITRWLQSKGYVDAQVHTEVRPASQGATLRFHITKGPKYLHGDFHYDLSENDFVFDSDKQIAEIGHLLPKGPYSPEGLHSASEKIATFLGTKGYTNARVIVQPRFDEDNPQIVHLDIQVISGEKSFVGTVHFTGNHTTKPRVILHELLLIPGDVLNTKALAASERRLANTSLFSRVHISTRQARDPVNDLKSYKDVVVDIEEKEGVGKFAFSFGANTTNLGYINFEIAEPNFNSKGFSRLRQDGLKALRGNGEYISANLKIAQRSLLHDIKWTYPYIFESPWTFSLRLDKGNHRDQTSYDLNRQGITFQFFNSPMRHAQLSLYSSLRYDKVDVRSPDSSAVTTAILDQEQFNGPKLSLGTAYNIQTIDHFIFPTRGLRSRTDFSLNRILNKSITYGRASQETSCYFPLMTGLTFKLRGDLHAVLPFGSTKADGLPISSKLLLGSDNCMRGFANQSIGASYIDEHPQGGLTVGFASAEIFYKLFPDLGLFAFSDNGVVSDGKLSFDKSYHSIGFGLRVNIGGQFPLSLGLGYPLQVDHESQRSNFIFEVGGHY